ncbi:hypothetical protein HELRODRAFT_173624 [Helobdella robusta]|uniref:PDZ domain-containing protein n=1 Tax=Helobdella robusta TaxID=6412 RepID=T1F723_HELRO|nr:hypothetical protein HELRODRAFT_173624 [Helobdella robusta]ESO03336.1 hypothetical protein HELRODRAFT_173624 [Helobdella robusta]
MDYYEENSKEEWYQNLSSWKNRRKSNSKTSLRTFEMENEANDDVTAIGNPDNDDEVAVRRDDDDEEEVEEKAGHAIKKRKFRNYKWNKYPTNDDDDDVINDATNDVDDDVVTGGGGGDNDRYGDGRRRNPDRDGKILHQHQPKHQQQHQQQQQHHQQQQHQQQLHQQQQLLLQQQRQQQPILKTIKISQRASNSRGFGFEISRNEKTEKIFVSKVSRGSSADICDVRRGDVITSVNGVDIGGHFVESVRHVITTSVEKGTIEMKLFHVFMGL